MGGGSNEARRFFLQLSIVKLILGFSRSRRGRSEVPVFICVHNRDSRAIDQVGVIVSLFRGFMIIKHSIGV